MRSLPIVRSRYFAPGCRISGYPARFASFASQNHVIPSAWRPMLFHDCATLSLDPAGSALAAVAVWGDVAEAGRIGMGIFAEIFGGVSVITGIIQFCPLWRALGINTCRHERQRKGHTSQVTTVDELRRQGTHDGFVHLATWIIPCGRREAVPRGARAAQVWAGCSLAGAMLAGWCMFNLVEGVIEHAVLGWNHHVLAGHPNELLFDVLFLGSGVARGS